MQITHKSIISPIFRLVQTLELDIQFGSESWTIRIDILQDISNPNQFRCDLWQLDYYRIQPTFPQDPDTGKPTAYKADQAIWMDWSHSLTGSYKSFIASDANDALNVVLTDLKEFLITTVGK